jgi:hypothetical protein
MVTLATPLNIICTCSQCSSFLRPILTLAPTHNARRTKKPELSGLILPIIANHTRTSTPSPSLPSAYPLVSRTPGLLRCMYALCSALVPGTSYRDALCERHKEELKMSVEYVVESWAGANGGRYEGWFRSEGRA